MRINNMTPKQLQKKIELFKEKAPITENFMTELSKIKKKNGNPIWNFEAEAGKYKNQKDHWTGWLSQYNGPGYYNRKNWKESTAKSVYNSNGCPPMILWLCEASGISKPKILEAKKEAINAAESFSSKCAAIRQVIPWEMVEKRLIEIKK